MGDLIYSTMPGHDV